MSPIGFYVNCDEAECATCHNPAEWEGFEEWEEPLVITTDDESDTPTHCRICEALIPHGLTRDGLDYVLEYVLAAKQRGEGRPCITAAWWLEYGDEFSPNFMTRRLDVWARRQPTRDEFSPAGNAA